MHCDRTHSLTLKRVTMTVVFLFIVWRWVPDIRNQLLKIFLDPRLLHEELILYFMCFCSSSCLSLVQTSIFSVPHSPYNDCLNSNGYQWSQVRLYGCVLACRCGGRCGWREWWDHQQSWHERRLDIRTTKNVRCSICSYFYPFYLNTSSLLLKLLLILFYTVAGKTDNADKFVSLSF